MKVYIALGKHNNPASHTYKTREMCEIIVNESTHGGIEDGRVRIVEFLSEDEVNELIKKCRVDAINEFARALRSAIRDDTCGCSWDAKEIVARIAEQLKEHKHEKNV